MRPGPARSAPVLHLGRFSWTVALTLIVGLGCSNPPAGADAAVADHPDVTPLDATPSFDAPGDVADASTPDAAVAPADASPTDVAVTPADASAPDVTPADVAVTPADASAPDVTPADASMMTTPDGGGTFWYTGEWRPAVCPSPCTPGTSLTRTVFCTNSSREFLPASACSGPSPATTNPCC